MRRICHLVTHLRPFPGQYIVDLAVEQARRGDMVMVGLCDDAAGRAKSDPALAAALREAGVTVISLGDAAHRDWSKLRSASLRLKDRVAPWDPGAVVHCHDALLSAVAAWADSPVLVSTCHGWDTSRPSDHDLQDALALSLCAGVTTPTAYWAERVSHLAGVSNVRLLPYGFDLCRYPELMTEGRGNSGAPRILCMGELTAGEGQDVLIAAMPAVWRAHPTAELHLIGKGDAYAGLFSTARAQDPGGRRIIFHGAVERPQVILGEFDLLCQPSRSDTPSMAIIEALLARLPVISTNTGGIPEPVATGECGLCVPPGDSVSLAHGLITWLDIPRETRQHRARKAGEEAARRFDIRTHALEMERWYESVRTAFVESPVSYLLA